MGEKSCQPFGLRPKRPLTLSRGLLIFAISASPRFALSTVLARNARVFHYVRDSQGARMLTGMVQWTAQERVIHGKPAADAVPAEIERIGAKRVLLLTTRSLTESRLVREVTSSLGDRCVGRF